MIISDSDDEQELVSQDRQEDQDDEDNEDEGPVTGNELTLQNNRQKSTIYIYIYSKMCLLVYRMYKQNGRICFKVRNCYTLFISLFIFKHFFAF